jgi:hypothetical protein
MQDLVFPYTLVCPTLYAVYDTGDTKGHTEDAQRGTRKLDLKSAAVALGVTSEAVRRRAKRGTLASEKGPDGKLYVWVPDVYDNGPHDGSHEGSHVGGTPPNLSEALLDRFEDENEFLKQEVERLHRELERKDAILMTMAQRIPELEASREAQGGDLTASEEQGKGDVPPEPEHRRSWLHRFFFGP